MPQGSEPSDRSRFLLFCVVGASGMVVDFSAFHLLRWFGLDGSLSLYANMISVAIAVQWNFAGNRWMTFRDRDTPLRTAWWRFNVFSSSTWVLNQIIFGGLSALFAPRMLSVAGITFSIVNVWKLIAIGICTFANFWLSSKLAFRETAAGPAQSDSGGAADAS